MAKADMSPWDGSQAMPDAAGTEEPTSEETTTLDLEVSDVFVRSATKREIEVRLLPWDTTIETVQGPEEFARGATVGTAQDGVLLMGLEHEAHMGLGQDGRLVPTRHAMGRSTSVWEADDGPHVVFRVARTGAGDDLLALAEDRIVRGVSLEFSELPGGTSTVKRGNRRVRVHNRVALKGASMTYQPAYGGQATVLAVRSQDEEGEQAMPETPVPETPEQPAAPAIDLAPVVAAIEAQGAAQTRAMELFGERFTAIAEEKSRTEIAIPSRGVTDPRAHRGEWVQAVIQMLSGERVNNIQMRALDDLITTDNIGVVPDAFLNELTGVIDASRPFLGSTRRLDLPPAGMSLVVPVIETRPTVGPQVNGSGTPTEKADIVSTATSITTDSFDAVTVAGGGDISIQLLKRSSPSFLSLYLELLAEAMSENAESLALAALLGSGINAGGTIDAEDLTLGAAWANGAAVKKTPNTIWLSSAAVGAFIDAKASGTNAPLYSSIQAGFTAASGTGGTISGLRPILVPALDATDTDVIVGPSSGFGWTEDGAFTLQVDVPAKAGRDVALVSIFWFATLYPDAFTGYTLGS
jgi:phage head maturation protease